MKRIAMLGLACLLAGPTNADDKEPAKAAVPTTATPNPRKDKWWQDRHEAYLKHTKAGGVQVAFLGDSITQGWENSGDAAWKKHFAPLHAGNYGIGGDQTQHLLWRITEGKELVGIAPKVAVVMIGTNNFGPHSPQDIATGIEAIVKALLHQERGTKVLLLGVFPRGGRPQGDKVLAKDLNPKSAAVNAIISKLDDGKRVFYLDIGKAFLAKDGSLSKDVMPDYLHLSADGYERWAKAILPKLKELMK